MAINIVDPPEQKTSGGKGGLIGKIVGGILGAIAGVAAAPTGGGSLALIPAAVGAAGTGSAVGSVAGSAADPVKVDKPIDQPSALESAAMQDPETAIHVFKLARRDLASSGLPQEEIAQKDSFLGQAQSRSEEMRDRIRNSMTPMRNT